LRFSGARLLYFSPQQICLWCFCFWAPYPSCRETAKNAIKKIRGKSQEFLTCVFCGVFCGVFELPMLKNAQKRYKKCQKGVLKKREAPTYLI
jgi:hypothetical protein